MHPGSEQVGTVYTQGELRQLVCRVLAELDGIAVPPIESDIQLSAQPTGLSLDCRLVAHMGRPLLQLGRRAQKAVREAIQAATVRELGEIRIIIDDIVPI